MVALSISKKSEIQHLALMHRISKLIPLLGLELNLGTLNFLEPSGPFQACNGTALPFMHESEYLFRAPPRALGGALKLKLHQLHGTSPA
jgi:hypothetical protein